jgi:hypothetical protein
MFSFYFFFAALKRDKNDISGTGSLLYEHNAMILSGSLLTSLSPRPSMDLILNKDKLNPTLGLETTSHGKHQVP